MNLNYFLFSLVVFSITFSFFYTFKSFVGTHKVANTCHTRYMTQSKDRWFTGDVYRIEFLYHTMAKILNKIEG